VIAKTDDTNDKVNDPAEHRRSPSVFKSPPRPVFRNPFEPVYKQRESTTSSSRSSEVGDSQGERRQCVSDHHVGVF